MARQMRRLLGEKQRPEEMRIKNTPVGDTARSNASLKITNEFQTPLGIIISAGEVLESYFDRLPPERRRLALEDILTAARQMSQSLDSLLEQDSKSSLRDQRS